MRSPPRLLSAPPAPAVTPMVAVAALALAVALLLCGCPRPTRPPPPTPPLTPQAPPSPPPTATPTPTPTPVPTPTPIYIPARRMESAKLFNGLRVVSTVDAEFGSTATVERNTPDSYVLNLEVRVRVPQPDIALAALAAVNPHLPTLLPSLENLLASARPSPFFADLYRRKIAALNYDLPRLNELLSRHNFYDCETVLELRHPATGRRALLIQADMDVVMDGSDSDRIPVTDGSSTHFQPTTSYKWKKRTGRPNPFLAEREQRVLEATQELARPDTPRDRADALRKALPTLRAELDDVRYFSYLVAAVDPFIVVPGSFYGAKSAFAPAIGDYCVVISGDRLYPAIVGDIGPRHKAGEASLRICKEINAQANAYNRALSELTATYLIFPGSADQPFGPPDLTRWRARCAQFLADLGGTAGTLYDWPDLTVPPPTPTPAPTPAAPATTTGTQGTAGSGGTTPTTTHSATSIISTATTTGSTADTPPPGPSPTASPKLVPIKPTLHPQTTPNPTGFP